MTHKSLEVLRQELVAADDIVAVNGLYRHSKSGNDYIVSGFTVLEGDDVVAVKYSPVDNIDIEFARPLGSFTEEVEVDSRRVARFQLLEEV